MPRKGAHEAFYFYDLYETFPLFSYDPTGVALRGRYTVRFEGGWSQAMGLGRGDVEIQSARRPLMRRPTAD